MLYSLGAKVSRAYVGIYCLKSLLNLLINEVCLFLSEVSKAFPDDYSYLLFVQAGVCLSTFGALWAR